jgi:hypothetical protein
MLYTIALVLLVLWIIGFATSFTAGGLLNLLVVLAVVLAGYEWVTGRRAA